MADIELIVRGTAYGGWKTLRVQRSMEQLAGDFRLSVSELWPGDAGAPLGGRVIVPGDECILKLDGEVVIRGYVDELSIQHGSRRHEVTVAGRDATGDLVDCSAVRSPGQWRSASIERIASDLAAPFGVKVRADVSTGAALPSFALQEGETVFEALSRLAAIKALLLVSDGQGGLVITRAGVQAAPTALVLGENILEAAGELSLKNRYSSYVKKGQAAVPFWDGDSSPRAPAQLKAQASDAEVKRYRPLVIVHDSPDVAASMQQQVEWERNTRAAKGTTVTVRVQGWRHAAGLWAPNTRVRVRDPYLRVDTDLLLKGVVYSLDDSGTTATLSLTRADAFALLPIRPVVAPVFQWDTAR